MIYLLWTKKAKPEDLPYLIFVFNTLNCLFWSVYGLDSRNSINIFYGNITGVFLGYILFAIFIVVAKKDSMALAITAIILVGATYGVMFWAGLIYLNPNYLHVTGIICFVFNIIMYVFPLSKIVAI